MPAPPDRFGRGASHGGNDGCGQSGFVAGGLNLGMAESEQRVSARSPEPLPPGSLKALTPDADTARALARIKNGCEKKGRPSMFADAWIAGAGSPIRRVTLPNTRCRNSRVARSGRAIAVLSSTGTGGNSARHLDRPAVRYRAGCDDVGAPDVPPAAAQWRPPETGAGASVAMGLPGTATPAGFASSSAPGLMR